MKFYVATRSIVDAVNGYHISSHTIIKTANIEWIKRFGSAFREIAAPDHPEILEEVVFVKGGVSESVAEEAPVVETVEQDTSEEVSDEEEQDSASEEEEQDSDTLSTKDVRPTKRVKRRIVRK